MNRVASLLLAVFTCFWVLVATDRKAWGYVDPGSGLLALQTFASVMAACGFFLRRRLRGLFGMKSREGKQAGQELPNKTETRNAA